MTTHTSTIAAYAAPVVVHDGPSSAEWDAYVSRHPDASAYHQRIWLEVIRRAFGHDTRALVAESAYGIVGVLPLVLFRSRIFGRFVVSIPFVNYGGILADSAAAARALLDAAIAEARRHEAGHLELRHTCRLFPELPCRRHKVAMLLPLESTVEKTWEGLDRKVRNQIRKAQKSQLRVEIAGSDRLPVFYQIFARNMRDLGTPVYGRRFFTEVLATFPSATRIFTVWLGDRPVAASIVYWHGSTFEVPWASSLSEFRHLCGNTLLYWEMISFAVREGFRTFDFGRSTPGEGTYQFKRQWGAEPRELVWEYWQAGAASLPDLRPNNPRFAKAIQVWRRLPVPLTTFLGPHIVRNIP